MGNWRIVATWFTKSPRSALGSNVVISGLILGGAESDFTVAIRSMAKKVVSQNDPSLSKIKRSFPHSRRGVMQLRLIKPMQADCVAACLDGCVSCAGRPQAHRLPFFVFPHQSPVSSRLLLNSWLRNKMRSW